MSYQSLGSFPTQPPMDQVAFHRTELSVILSLYGRMVAAGEWRDYGISSLRDLAVYTAMLESVDETMKHQCNGKPGPDCLDCDQHNGLRVCSKGWEPK